MLDEKQQSAEEAGQTLKASKTKKLESLDSFVENVVNDASNLSVTWPTEESNTLSITIIDSDNPKVNTTIHLENFVGDDAPASNQKVIDFDQTLESEQQNVALIDLLTSNNDSGIVDAFLSWDYNTAPIAQDVDDQVVTENTGVQSFFLLATDPDMGDSVTFSINESLPAGVTLDAQTGLCIRITST